MTCARPFRLLALVLAAGLPAAPALAQQGVPPSVQQEIDRALSRVPQAHRPAPGRATVDPDVERFMNRARAASPRQVALAFENKTPYKMLVVQFAPVGSTEWGANRLQRETLGPRGTMRWRLNSQECRYDVRITFAMGNEFVRLDHDFCAQEKMDVTSPEAATEALPTREGVALFRVVNRTNAQVAILRVTPVGASRPQPDLLGIWMMEHGDNYTGRVARNGTCLYDVRVGFDAEDTQSMTLARQNLCETPEIVLPARRAAGG